MTRRVAPSTSCPPLQRKDLALEDVFAALDADLDGCLRAGPGSAGARELGRLLGDVMPGLPASELQLFSALADFDGDGFVSMEDLVTAGGQTSSRGCLVVQGWLAR